MKRSGDHGNVQEKQIYSELVADLFSARDEIKELKVRPKKYALTTDRKK
jgi:hypothetical protein